MKATTSAELIEEMAPHVARFIRHKLRYVPFITSQDLEDITQEALLGAHKAKTPCDPRRSDAEIRSWFFKVALTHIGRHFGALTCKKRTGRTHPVENQWFLSTGEPTPLEIDLQQDRCSEILETIRGMQPWMRDTLLRHLKLMEPGERKPSGERAILAHARVELRRRLQRRGIIPSPASTAGA